MGMTTELPTTDADKAKLAQELVERPAPTPAETTDTAATAPTAAAVG